MYNKQYKNNFCYEKLEQWNSPLPTLVFSGSFRVPKLFRFCLIWNNCLFAENAF